MSNDPSVDGFSVPDASEADEPKVSGSAKTTFLVAFLSPYALYLLWCVFLLSVLPNANGDYDGLVPIGIATSALGGILLLMITGILLKRVMDAKVDQFNKTLGVAKIAGVLVPGLALSAFVPLQIPKEPPLRIQIIDPTDTAGLQAPIAVTYSLEAAQDILEKRGLRVERVQWDFDGNGEPNEETIEPIVTAIYDKKGAYTVVARMILNDASQRRVVTQLVIPDSVFSVFPLRPVINEPVTFSVAHLLSTEVGLKEVSWDFDSDGEIDELTTEQETSFTYFRPGLVKISAILTLTNQSQIRLEKEILVSDPPPLPFPVEIVTEPENLVGPAPFGVLFSIDTKEPYEKVVWNIGDQKEATGDRIGHTFESNGNYYVTAQVYSLSGAIAKLSRTVRIVDVLRLPDLVFTGSNPVNNRKITAEVPLNLELKPETTQPLINFRWEVPNATSVESTDTTLKATYRKAGSYTVTLVATGPSGNVLRLPITVEVKPPSSQVVIRMQPEGGVAPLSVRFDASETVIQNEEISGFEWKFGDESSQAIQGGAQIEYVFEQPGTYKVFATAFTTSGKSFPAERTIVVRSPVLDACFKTSRTTGVAPLGVSFTMDCTTGVPSVIQWDFGDGAKSDERNPIHVFERAGSYTVTLRLQDDQGTTSQETLIITANAQ